MNVEPFAKVYLYDAQGDVAVGVLRTGSVGIVAGGSTGEILRLFGSTVMHDFEYLGESVKCATCISTLKA